MCSKTRPPAARASWQVGVGLAELPRPQWARREGAAGPSTHGSSSMVSPMPAVPMLRIDRATPVVAEFLGMSPRTVNTHREHIFEKLGVETRAAAAALAVGKLP